MNRFHAHREPRSRATSVAVGAMALHRGAWAAMAGIGRPHLQS